MNFRCSCDYEGLWGATKIKLTGVIAICLFAVLSSQPLKAESSNSVSYVAEEAISLKKVFMGRPNLSTREREILGSVEILVEDKAKPIGRAEMRGSKRVVILHSGIADAVMLYSRYAAARAGGGCQRYLDYLSGEISQLRSTAPISAIEQIRSPADYCQANVSDDAANKIFQETFTPVLGMMLAHELSHHMLGHIPVRKPLPPDQRRKIEADADRRGGDLLGSYAFTTGAAIIFDILHKQHGGDQFVNVRNYDPPVCRVIFYMTRDQTGHGAFYAEQEYKRLLSTRADLRDMLVRAANFAKDPASDPAKCETLKYTDTSVDDQTQLARIRHNIQGKKEFETAVGQCVTNYRMTRERCVTVLQQIREGKTPTEEPASTSARPPGKESGGPSDAAAMLRDPRARKAYVDSCVKTMTEVLPGACGGGDGCKGVWSQNERHARKMCEDVAAGKTVSPLSSGR